MQQYLLHKYFMHTLDATIFTALTLSFLSTCKSFLIQYLFSYVISFYVLFFWILMINSMGCTCTFSDKKQAINECRHWNHTDFTISARKIWINKAHRYIKMKDNRPLQSCLHGWNQEHLPVNCPDPVSSTAVWQLFFVTFSR